MMLAKWRIPDTSARAPLTCARKTFFLLATMLRTCTILENDQEALLTILKRTSRSALHIVVVRG